MTTLEEITLTTSFEVRLVIGLILLIGFYIALYGFTFQRITKIFNREIEKEWTDIVFFGSLIFIVFIVFYPSSAFSYLTEFLAGFLGVLGAFTLQKTQDRENQKEMSDLLINNLIIELNENLDLVKSIQQDTNKGRMVLFRTASWEMFKEKIIFSTLDVQFELASLYHKIEQFNTIMIVKGSINQTTSFLGEADDYYTNLQKTLESTLGLLES
jgi:uncharacterized membrane protein